MNSLHTAPGASDSAEQAPQDHQLDSLETPDGAFTLITTQDSVLAAGWTEDVASLLQLIHPALRPQAGRLVRSRISSGAAGMARDAVVAYYDGDLAAPGRVPVAQKSGPFREHAWEVLRAVRAGHPVTYTEYAALAGKEQAVRAAAGACAMNAVALFVPCHRVIRTDGSLGGFRYGLETKRRLLMREAQTKPLPSPKAPQTASALVEQIQELRRRRFVDQTPLECSLRRRPGHGGVGPADISRQI